MLFAIYARETSGKERFNIPNASLKSLSHGHQGWRPKQWHLFNTSPSTTSVDYIIYGDSFSAQYSSYFKQQDKSIANIYEGECFSTPNYYSYGNKCLDLYDQLQKGMNITSSNTLVIAQSWNHILNGLKSRTNNQLLNYNQDEFIIHLKDELKLMKQELSVQKIILIGINNGFIGPTPEECISQKFIKDAFAPYFQKSHCQDIAPLQNKNSVEVFNHKLQTLADTTTWIEFINPNNAICTNNQCIQIEENLSYYSDPSHFSIIGADKVGRYIFDELEILSQ